MKGHLIIYVDYTLNCDKISLKYVMVNMVLYNEHILEICDDWYSIINVRVAQSV